MSDMRDILGIQAPKAPTGPSMPGSKVRLAQGPPPMEPKAKKPRLSREVSALKSSYKNAPASMMPAILSEAVDEKKQFKAKIVLGTKRVSKYERKPFKIPTRTDAAVFHHWQKAKRGMEEVNKFSKFNRKLSIPIYNDAEYDSKFKSDSWTRQETDYLFKLCNEFDLRFLVIADRWNPPSNAIKSHRTIEEIKDRYYTVQRGLLLSRKSSNSEVDPSTNPLIQHAYDPVREAERKRQQNLQSSRTSEDIATEAEITAETARIDSTFKKHSEDALKYLRLIKKQQKYYTNLKQERKAYQAAKEQDERTKARKGGPAAAAAAAAAATASSSSASSQMDVDTPQPAPAHADTTPAHQRITRRHPAVYSRTHAKSYTQTLVPLLNQQKYAPLYAKALPELQMDAIPRNSFIIVAAITELRCDLLLLHEMQRLHSEKAFELEVLRNLQRSLQERLKTPKASREAPATQPVQTPAVPQATSSSTSSTAEPTQTTHTSNSMDVDE